MTRLTLKQLQEEIEELKKEIANLKRAVSYQGWQPQPKKCPCCRKVKTDPYSYINYGECGA